MFQVHYVYSNQRACISRISTHSSPDLGFSKNLFIDYFICYTVQQVLISFCGYREALSWLVLMRSNFSQELWISCQEAGWSRMSVTARSGHFLCFTRKILNFTQILSFFNLNIYPIKSKWDINPKLNTSDCHGWIDFSNESKFPVAHLYKSTNRNAHCPNFQNWRSMKTWLYI